MTTSPEIVLNAAKTLAWGELEPRQREIYLGCARIELADRASVADRGVQAVPGEPVVNITAGRVKLLADVFAEEACDFLSKEAPSKEQEDAYYKAKSALYKAIDTLAASVASPAAPASPVVPGELSYPLPDALYPGSKDWLFGNYAARVEWLHTMYEAVKVERDELLAAPASPSVAQAAPASPSVAQAEPSERAPSLVASEKQLKQNYFRDGKLVDHATARMGFGDKGASK